MADKQANERRKRLARRLRDNLRRRKQRPRQPADSTRDGDTGKGPATSGD